MESIAFNVTESKLESQKGVKQIEVLLNLKQKIIFSTLNL